MAKPRFLLDSNILIYVIGGYPEALRTRIEQERPGALATSTVCIAELMVGADRRTRDHLAALLERIPALDFDLAAAEAFRLVPFTRGRFDRLIAAHALALGAVLVTANSRDFADVPGLGIEDWTRA